MTEAEEVAYIVRKFDEITKSPPPPPKKRRGLLGPAIFLMAFLIIIIIAFLYYRKNGMPKLKNPFVKSKPLETLEAPTSKNLNGNEVSLPKLSSPKVKL